MHYSIVVKAKVPGFIINQPISNSTEFCNWIDFIKFYKACNMVFITSTILHIQITKVPVTQSSVRVGTIDSWGAHTGGSRSILVVPQLTSVLLTLSLSLLERTEYICFSQEPPVIRSFLCMFCLNYLRNIHMGMFSFLFRRDIWAGDIDLDSLKHIGDSWSWVWGQQRLWRVWRIRKDDKNRVHGALTLRGRQKRDIISKRITTRGSWV